MNVSTQIRKTKGEKMIAFAVAKVDDGKTSFTIHSIRVWKNNDKGDVSLRAQLPGEYREWKGQRKFFPYVTLDEKLAEEILGKVESAANSALLQKSELGVPVSGQKTSEAVPA